MSKRCWLADGCPSRTAVCSSCEPDGDECPIWRWFREQIVVRCKDCKHFNNHAIAVHGLNYGECNIIGQFVDTDWFCADGERN